ncbi:MAG: S8 family serine peptidase, partial [Alistipes sp.]|nr:S8 family serine peptidase [Alistipes sp.]
QFSTRAVMPQEKMIPVNIADFAQTRSEELPFDDPNLAQQWHYNNDGTVDFPNAKAGADINLFSAWKHTAGRNDVIVAVVDEGVCYTHEDLAANMWVNKGEVAGNGVDDDGNGYIDDIHGYNFADGGKITWNKAKDSGHGTHVAGTVAAVNNNGIGVCGVAGGTGKGDGVRIMSCQIMSNGDSAGPATTAEAIEYAADNGACVLQNSWGFEAGAIGNDYMFETGQTGVEIKAFEYFMKKKNCEALDGGIVIFAAGNDSKSVAGYPAAWNKLIAVTAIAPDGLPTHYTCYDRGCNVAAPGGEYGPQVSKPGCVLSTLPPDVPGAKGAKYALYQGTSMACPHVSGIAALAISYALDNGIKMSLPELKDIIVSSVRNLNDFMDTNFKTNYDPYSAGSQINLASYKNKMGTGLIDAERVLMAVRGTTCIPVPVGEQFTLDISKYIGDGKGSIKMLQTTIPNDVIETLGIEGLKFTAGKYMMTCTKPGTALVKLKYVAGGTVVGGGQIVGGMETEQEFAIIARPGYTIDPGTLTPNNPGGWL